jgi:hypothetical protein
MERINGVLGDTIRTFEDGREESWDVWLPYAVFKFAMNSGWRSDSIFNRPQRPP